MPNSRLDYDKMSKIINEVDIVKIQNSSEDIGTFCNDDIVKSSGVKYLNEVIKNILGKYSDKYFFEYALLPSTLDPDKEKLYSMSAVQDNSVNAKDNPQSFLSLIERNVKNIIDHLFEKHHELNFFHNPETFLAPSEINIIHSFSDQLDKKADERNNHKIEKFKNNSYDHLIPNKYIPADNGLYLSNMTYDRRFDDIISSAKIIFDENKTHEKLIEQYEHGATDLRYFYDKIINLGNEKACYITLPILSSSSEDFPEMYKKVFGNELKGRKQGIGVFFIYFYVKPDFFNELIVENNIKRIEQELFIEINNLIRVFTYNYVFNIGLRLAERAKENSIKSAIAAIMARNMSHNLGSHVFYYTRNEIDSLSQSESKNRNMFKGLSYFLQYVQERQDFVATITSQEPQAFGPFNLKANVFDIITPDAHEKRHKSLPPPTNFLLKYIAFSEGLTRDDFNTYSNIEIILKKDNIEFNSWPPTLRRKEYDTIVSKFYDIDFAVKGGQNSSHAFLIILENIIRNAAKHGRNSSSIENLNITIEVFRRGEKYIIQIYDNCNNAADATNPLNEQLESICIINENEGGSINKESKGLKEIIVCVGWLKGKKYSEIFNANNIGIRKDILSIQDKNGNLCYSFELPCYNESISVSNVKKTIDNINKRKYNSFASFYICNDEKECNLLKSYLPRCVRKVHENKDGSFWKQYFKKSGLLQESLSKNTDDILIIFERDEHEQLGNFVFCKDQSKLGNTILGIDKPFILFKNHLSKNSQSIKTYLEFEEKWNDDIISKRLSLENISGGNYSFNLLQRAKQLTKGGSTFDEDLYYHILEAYLTQIVIVDERLCSEKLTFETLRTELSEAIINDLDLIKIILDKYLFNNKGLHLKALQNIQNTDRLNDYIEQKGFTSDIKSEIIHGNSKNENKLLRLKNIFLFNLDSRKMNLIDYEGNLIKNYTFKDNKINPKFFSIHIGILDKISKETIMNDKGYEFSNKIETLKKIFIIDKLRYIKYKFSIPNSTYISVHSGRGGLNESEQGITFIPFTSLQSSFENCKFVLSDLFYNQIYFPI